MSFTLSSRIFSAIVLVVAAFALTAEARTERTKIGAILARMKTRGQIPNMKTGGEVNMKGVGMPDGCDDDHYCPDDSGDTDGWCCDPHTIGDDGEWVCCPSESPYICAETSNLCNVFNK